MKLFSEMSKKGLLSGGLDSAGLLVGQSSNKFIVGQPTAVAQAHAAVKQTAILDVEDDEEPVPYNII